MGSIQLETVLPDQNQIDYLYDLLISRIYTISHERNPTREEHERFVRNHPYRHWDIVLCRGQRTGCVYVQYDNSIGLNGVDDLSSVMLRELIELIREKYQPLPAEKSQRFRDFYFNVAINNVSLQEKLIKVGYKVSQVTLVKKVVNEKKIERKGS
jgi:hypothetical protein